jgi:hypothetical protein
MRNSNEIMIKHFYIYEIGNHLFEDENKEYNDIINNKKIIKQIWFKDCNGIPSGFTLFYKHKVKLYRINKYNLPIQYQNKIKSSKMLLYITLNGNVYDNLENYLFGISSKDIKIFKKSFIKNRHNYKRYNIN